MPGIPDELIATKFFSQYQVDEFKGNITNGEFAIVTARKLVNNKWQTKTKKFKINDYYKN